VSLLRILAGVLAALLLAALVIGAGCALANTLLGPDGGSGDEDGPLGAGGLRAPEQRRTQEVSHSPAGGGPSSSP
jgi:hypothetical protein